MSTELFYILVRITTSALVLHRQPPEAELTLTLTSVLIAGPCQG